MSVGPGPVGLLGSGEFTPAMRELDLRLLGDRPRRVVHLPTAAGQEGPRRLAYWERLAREHFTSLGVSVDTIPVVDHQTADDPEMAARVAGAGLIYLSGGNPGYLAVSLRNTLTWEAIVTGWRLGVALAGCSAGAAALGRLAPDMRSGDRRQAGLGLVDDLAIVPHYDMLRRWRRGAVREITAAVPPGVWLVGVDEDTAIVRSDSTWEVYGSGSATLVSSGMSFSAGQTIAFERT
jgi:cyanophycinase